jgi:arylsulfatase
MGGRTSLTVFNGMIGMAENAFINIKNRSHTITAEIENGTNGVILAQAGRFGGWSLYVKDGKPIYTYNWLGLNEYTVAGTEALPPGKVNDPFRVCLRRWRHRQGRSRHTFRQREERRYWAH